MITMWMSHYGQPVSQDNARSLSPSRSRRFVTVETCQRRPRRVSMPRLFSSSGDCPEAGRTTRANIRNHRCQVLRMPVRVPHNRSPERRTALASPPQRRRANRVAEPHAAAPRHCQRLLGPPRDRLALGLRHQRHDPDGEVARGRRPLGAGRRPRLAYTDLSAVQAARLWARPPGAVQATPTEI